MMNRKKVPLTLTTKWWQEITDNPNISNLLKNNLLSALGSFTTPSTPPALTAALKKGEFEKIISEIEKITLNGEEMFIVCETHPEVSHIRITNQKSPNWDESIWIPGHDCNEGWPEHSDKSVYLIRTRNDDIYYARIDESNHEQEGIKWLTLSGKIVNPKTVTGWFKLC